MLRIAALLLCASCATVAAQTTVPRGADHPGAACPPGTGSNAPTVGKDQEKPLSDQLAQSKGVICPPAGVDNAWDCLNNPGTIYSSIAEPARSTLWIRAFDQPDRQWIELDLSEPFASRRAAA